MKRLIHVRLNDMVTRYLAINMNDSHGPLPHSKKQDMTARTNNMNTGSTGSPRHARDPALKPEKAYQDNDIVELRSLDASSTSIPHISNDVFQVTTTIALVKPASVLSKRHSRSGERMYAIER